MSGDVEIVIHHIFPPFDYCGSQKYADGKIYALYREISSANISVFEC